MSLGVEVIQHKEYVEAIVSGEFDLQDAVDKFQVIIITCKIAGLSKVLIDFRELEGDILALQKIICSFQVIEQVKLYFESKSSDIQLAYLGKAPQVSSYKPGLEIAKMEGIQAIVTVDINEAYEWLGVKAT